MDVLFDARQRLIALHAGEILVETSPDPAPVARPFIVRTREGSITALGTRFVVRRDDGVSTVQVLDGAVRVAPRGAASDRARQVPAGMSLRFGDGIDEGLAPVAGDPSAWQRGMLQVDGMPLRTFLAELQRYRSGWIDCAPEVAHLPISGAFPLEDTDRVGHSGRRCVAPALPHALLGIGAAARRQWNEFVTRLALFALRLATRVRPTVRSYPVMPPRFPRLRASASRRAVRGARLFALPLAVLAAPLQAQTTAVAIAPGRSARRSRPMPRAPASCCHSIRC